MVAFLLMFLYNQKVLSNTRPTDISTYTHQLHSKCLLGKHYQPLPSALQVLAPCTISVICGKRPSKRRGSWVPFFWGLPTLLGFYSTETKGKPAHLETTHLCRLAPVSHSTLKSIKDIMANGALHASREWLAMFRATNWGSKGRVPRKPRPDVRIKRLCVCVSKLGPQ